MQENGYIHFNQAEGRDCLTLGGDWTVAHYIDLKKQLANLGDVPQSVTCNIESMKKLDTAGVQLLYRALGEHKLRQLPLTEQQHNLIDTVINACSNQEPPLPPKSNGFVKMLERIGISMIRPLGSDIRPRMPAICLIWAMLPFAPESAIEKIPP